MSFNLYFIFLIIGGVELFILFRRNGKTREVYVYAGIYAMVIILGLLTALELVERNFSFIMDFFPY